MPNVYLTIGIQGSGKSTWANQQDAIVISSDAIREELYGDASYQGDNARIFDTVYFRARRAAEAGHDVVIDSTNIKEQWRKRFFLAFSNSVCKEYNIKRIAVVFITPVEECIKRNNGRDRQVPEQVIRKYHRMMELPTLNEKFDKTIGIAG